VVLIVNRIKLDLKTELAAELAALPDTWTGQDLLAAIAFLHGRRGLHGGAEYLKPGSFAERSGRQALARLLRRSQPLSRIVRHMLANLIDTEFCGHPREFRLKRRGKTRLSASIRDHEVAHFIAWRVETGMLMKNAKADAMDHFKITKATMNRAWSKYGKDMTDQARLTLAELKKGHIPRR
jgi:hypothetical protein